MHTYLGMSIQEIPQNVKKVFKDQDKYIYHDFSKILACWERGVFVETWAKLVLVFLSPEKKENRTKGVVSMRDLPY